MTLHPPLRRTWRDHRGGPVAWSEISALLLADLWERTCEHRRATGQPLPPEHLRPNTIPTTKGDTP